MQGWYTINCAQYTPSLCLSVRVLLTQAAGSDDIVLRSPLNFYVVRINL